MTKIVLVDDDRTINIIHTAIIRRFRADIETKSFESAADMLDELNSLLTPDFDKLIFLIDINMPEINGFSCIEKMTTASPTILEKANLYLLSSSLDERDRALAKMDPKICEMLSKPLDDATLTRILAAPLCYGN